MTNALDAATFEHILTLSEPTTPATAMETVRAIRALAQARCAAHVEARVADSEARTDAWAEFEDACLSDGRRPLEVYTRCRKAFNAAWPQGRREALSAARRALDPERTIRSSDHLFDLIAGSLFDHPNKPAPTGAVRMLSDDLWELMQLSNTPAPGR